MLYKLRCILDHKVIGPILISRKKKYHDINGVPPRVNIGGGNFLRADWANMDYVSPDYPYMSGVVDYNYDLLSCEPFPFEDNSIDLFYSSHCFEHIYGDNFKHIFSEIYRSLKPGGGIRITAPDYMIYYRAYDKSRNNEPDGSRKAMDKFVGGFASYFEGRVSLDDFRKNFETMSPTEIAEYYCSRIPRESPDVSFEDHINWWTVEKLDDMLRAAGFSDVFPSKPFESRFPELREKIKMFGIEKISTIQGMMGFDSHAEEFISVPEFSLYVDAVK